MDGKKKNPQRALYFDAIQRDSARRDSGARQSRAAAVTPRDILRMRQVQIVVLFFVFYKHRIRTCPNCSEYDPSIGECISVRIIPSI